MAAVLTSDQVNYLIWRYLQESGFRDSAYAFQRDSKAERMDARYRTLVKAGTLIKLVQRGLLYEELADCVQRDGTIRKPDRPFSFLPQVSALVLEEDEGVGSDGHHLDEDEDGEYEEDDSVTIQSKSPPTTSTTSTNAKKHAMEDGVNGVAKKRRKKTSHSVDGDVIMADAVPSPPLTEEIPATNGRSVGTQIEDVDEITETSIVIVEHQVATNDDKESARLLSCAWNPVMPTLLATASMGPAARIWNIPDDATSPETLEHILLTHDPSRAASDNSKVTTIRWSPEGSQLASGSYDGQTRIWSSDGRMLHTMGLHYAPLQSLRWNRTASVLLALSCDGMIIAWDAVSGEKRRGFDLGVGAVTEIEWISESQFIGCGNTGNIHILDVGVGGPLHSQPAHQGEVMCIAWDEATKTVATGGADHSVLIWHKPGKDAKPVIRLTGHNAGVVSVSWQPGTAFDPAAPRRILASASDDCTIRLWDVTTQTCVHTLVRHQDPIERICFSPDGTKLASGANGAVLVWKVDSGTPTHVYDRAKSLRKNSTAAMEDVNEIGAISWDEGGQRLAIGEGPQRCAVVSITSKPSTIASNGSV